VAYSPSYIMKNRYGVFYFQYRIPKKILEFSNGKKLFRVSLRTKIRRDALKRSRMLWILMDKLARQFFNSPESFGKGMELLMKYNELLSCDWETVENFLMGFDEWDDYALERAIKYSEAKSIESQNIQQENDFLKKTIQLLQNKSQPYQETESSPKLNSENTLISELVEKYISECRNHWSKRHYGGNERDIIPKLKLFIEIIGDKSIHDVRKEDIFRYKELISRYPAHKSKKLAYKNLSIQDISDLTIPDEDRLSVTTIGNHFIKINSFLAWCENNISLTEKGLRKPLSNIPKSTVPADEQRDAFSAEDLKKLFESKEYIQGTHSCLSHFWVPLLGLFTGARENELCQLYKKDIYEDKDSNIWVIDINETEKDKKLKNPSHKRIIPVHKQLISLGFIDFVESVTTERLFSDLPRKRDGYGDIFSKWFNRTYRNERNCNVGNLPNEKKNFHSFRHTVITQLHNDHRISQSLIARLVGHKPNDQSETTNRYSKKQNIEENSKIINKLTFSSIDFKKIRKLNKKTL